MAVATLFEAPLHRRVNHPLPKAILISPRFKDDARLQAAFNNRPVMRIGARGSAVAKVQQALIDLGYKMLITTKRNTTPDGIFGNETFATVQKFQRRYKLLVDGRVGRQTLDMLDKLFPPQIPGRQRFLRMRHNYLVGDVSGVRVGPTSRVVRTAFRPRLASLIGPITPPHVNTREKTLDAMNRLHVLWSMGNNDYTIEYPTVSALPPGSTVQASAIPLTINAISRTQEPTLHHLVARNFFNQPLGQPVGRGMPNARADVFMIQDVLRGLNILNPSDHVTEHASVARSTSVVDADRVMPRTLAAITNVKNAIASNVLGWEPLHADEIEAGGDKFCGRTFDFQVSTLCFFPNERGPRVDQHIVSVFVPRGATLDTSKVHIFFGPRQTARNIGGNDTLVQGLRHACEETDWILIGVSGISLPMQVRNKEGQLVTKGVDGWRTIDDATIHDCLARAARSTNVTAITMSGHSRGCFSLAQTISRRVITTPIQRIVILDEASYFGGGRPGVIAYRVNDHRSIPMANHRDLNPLCMRAIGYTRLIKNAMITRPSLVIPPNIMNQLLPIPDRGCFSTKPKSQLSGCQVNITDFCNQNSRAIATIIHNERNTGQGRQTPQGLHNFVEANNLLRAGHGVTPEIYSHHLFVAEIAHEITSP